MNERKKHGSNRRQAKRKKEEINRRRKGGKVSNQSCNLVNVPLLLICLFIKKKTGTNKL